MVTEAGHEKEKQQNWNWKDKQCVLHKTRHALSLFFLCLRTSYEQLLLRRPYSTARDKHSPTLMDLSQGAAVLSHPCFCPSRFSVGTFCLGVPPGEKEKVAAERGGEVSRLVDVQPCIFSVCVKWLGNRFGYQLHLNLFLMWHLAHEEPVVLTLLKTAAGLIVLIGIMACSEEDVCSFPPCSFLTENHHHHSPKIISWEGLRRNHLVQVLGLLCTWQFVSKCLLARLGQNTLFPCDQSTGLYTSDLK